MSARITLATTARVLAQIRHDPRTIALLLVVPSALLFLLQQLLGDVAFDRLGAPMVGMFPFITMFLVTSISMLRERTTGTLSSGQRSRVSLAAALLGEPELLVLDEPNVGLDPVLRRDLWTLFHRLAEEGATLLVSSHVMDEAARCDRLLLMREGALVADTTPDELRERTGEQEMESAFLRLVEG